MYNIMNINAYNVHYNAHMARYGHWCRLRKNKEPGRFATRSLPVPANYIEFRAV